MKFVTLALLFVASSSAVTPSLFPKEEKTLLLGTLGELKNSLERLLPDPGFRESASQSMQVVEYFHSAATKWEPRRPDEGRGLRISFQKILRVVQNLPAAAPEAMNALLAISEDLSDKKSVCWRQGLGATPQVEVRPKIRGLADAQGLEVLYLEKFLASD